MKTITPIIVLIYLLAACSPENNDATQSPKPSAFTMKDGVTIPNNPYNSYDFVGATYTELLDGYYSTTANPTSLQQVILEGESLALQNAGFLALMNSEGYSPITVSQVQPYFQTVGDVTDLLSTGYGGKSREIFTDISLSLASLKQSGANYQEVYNELAGIEAITMNNAEIPNAERAGILTTTSILRNALYHDTKRKRRDRDWEWMIGNIAATANAALESKADALLIAFATDVYLP